MRQFEKLLVGGIWCIVTLKYHFEEDQKGSPFSVTELKPIQMPNMDMAALFEARKSFTDEQWIDALIRSTGMEPSHFKERVKWHLLARMVQPGMAAALGVNFFSRFVGRPDSVAQALLDLEGLGFDRIQLTPASPGSLTAVGTHLGLDQAPSA